MKKITIGQWKLNLEDISSFTPIVICGAIVGFRIFSVRDQNGQQQMIDLTRSEGFELEAAFQARNRAHYPVEGGD